MAKVEFDKSLFGLFRDSALMLEKADKKKAYQLMQLANLLRPEGPLIQKKLNEYIQTIGLMKIVTIGNCQIEPISRIMENHSSKIWITRVVPVHIAESGTLNQIKYLLDDADIIITQPVTVFYRGGHFSTEKLQNAYPDKVKKILNLHFEGYFPDWCYLPIPPGRVRLKGPMGDYHNKTIIDGWVAKETTETIDDKMHSYTYNKHHYEHSFDDSLKELKRREKNVDVKICDFIERHFLNERLFFTANHPVLLLLNEYSHRILKQFNVETDGSSTILKEPLDKVVIKINPISKSSFADPSQYCSNGKNYSTHELIDYFKELYDQNPEYIEFYLKNAATKSK